MGAGCCRDGTANTGGARARGTADRGWRGAVVAQALHIAPQDIAPFGGQGEGSLVTATMVAGARMAPPGPTGRTMSTSEAQTPWLWPPPRPELNCRHRTETPCPLRLPRAPTSISRA